MINLDKLKFPLLSIYKDIEKWYNCTEKREVPLSCLRMHIFVKFDRYIVRNSEEVLSLEEKNNGKESVSLISLFPWFDENKYFEYADMLVDKRAYTSQFEHVFNAFIAHYLMKSDIKTAQKFMHRVFDRALSDEHKDKIFSVFVPDTGSGLRPSIAHINKAILILKYSIDHPDVTLKSYHKNSLINNLVHARDVEEADLSRETLKTIDQILSKFPKMRKRFEYYGSTQNGIDISSSPDVMIQAFESNPYVINRTLSCLDDFWETKTSKMVKECYEKYPERFINVLRAYFSGDRVASVIRSKARLLSYINRNAEYLNVSENILPYMSDAFQAEYLQFII